MAHQNLPSLSHRSVSWLGVLYSVYWLKNLLCYYMIHGSNIVSYYVTTGAQLSGTSTHLANLTYYVSDRGTVVHQPPPPNPPPPPPQSHIRVVSRVFPVNLLASTYHQKSFIAGNHSHSCKFTGTWGTFFFWGGMKLGGKQEQFTEC